MYKGNLNGSNIREMDLLKPGTKSITSMAINYNRRNICWVRMGKFQIYYSHFARDHYLGRCYILRHGYHQETKNDMYLRIC